MAHSGVASRRTAEDMIRDGRVTVDGEPAHLGQKIDPQSQRVEIDGIPLPVRPDLVHILLNKPAGVVSTASDPRGRPTVVDLVDQETRVYPVGRLDADSEGLILVTNDGELTEVVTHPRFQLPKTYVARVEGHPGKAVMREMVDGIDLDDGLAKAMSSRLVDRNGSEALVEVVMAEGRKREIRRMLAAVGHPVTRLVRVAIGPIRDRDLAPGDHRALTTEEVRSLYAAATVG